ncbi:acyltransferase [Megasphaera vaginalis (ex Bordigoni et al. 2020)]|uniref:acyltransferase n=1 Tax=Megasphaera vaginalis (ex Bordigoni et al. 2020) TaxID=2045301 RepID=UPI000C7D4D3E|nr:acyltransferase [Megasphaera vaginalis (ex Bordigoni et al. 2020)]
MSKRFISSINYMRGICMLGVIAIHVGSVALLNPTPNLALVGVLEILSRFSVPAFFFLSAFGMFYSQPLHEPFHYMAYLRRRLRTVFVPYVTWSLFYLAFTAVLSHNWQAFAVANLTKTFFYGLAMYHIYFLVILLWFYLLMPLWRRLLHLMEHGALLSFIILFAANVLFNFYSSYIWTLNTDNPFLQDAFTYRLNYMVFHYLFIFMFGAYTAEHFEVVTAWLSRHSKLVIAFQLIASAAMLAAYCGVMTVLGYDALSAVFTVHQLSPCGMIYTVSTLLFLLWLWECRPVSPATHRIFSLLGNYSYPIYLVHPVFLSICTGFAARYGITLRAIYIIIIYCLVTAAASLWSVAISRLSLPRWLSICLQGK